MKRLREERERLLAQIEALKNQVVGLERAISVMEGNEYRPVQDTPRNRSRNVKDTVLGLLAEAGRNGLSVNQVIDFARAKGVDLDRGTVSSLLSRLKRESTLDMKDGQYFIRPPLQTERERTFATH